MESDIRTYGSGQSNAQSASKSAGMTPPPPESIHIRASQLEAGLWGKKLVERGHSGRNTANCLLCRSIPKGPAAPRGALSRHRPPWLHSGYLGVKYCRKQLGTFTAISQSKILAIFS
jgi:hypothetical protein